MGLKIDHTPCSHQEVAWNILMMPTGAAGKDIHAAILAVAALRKKR
jgi:hypothetical protein